MGLLHGVAAMIEAASPPTPTGTVYYRTGTSINAIKADGSGSATNLLPNYVNMTWPVYGNANPAFNKAGGNSTQDRWYIYPGNNGTYDEYVTASGTQYNYPHRDLYALRSNPADRSQLIVVQLTDLYGVVTFNPAAGFWSNDDNDGVGSFVGCAVDDFRSAYEEIEDPDTGEITTRVNATQRIWCQARLPLTVSDLNEGGIIPISTDTITEPELDAMLWAPMFRAANSTGQGIVSPNGLLYLSQINLDGTRLEQDDAATGGFVQLVWDGSSGAPNVMSGGQWSPDGLTIAFGERVSTYPAGGHIWTRVANASAAPKKVLSATTSGSTKTAYSSPFWSPDNKFVVVIKQKFSGTTVTGAWLTRVTVADGKTTDLVSIPTSGSNSILRWVSNN